MHQLLVHIANEDPMVAEVEEMPAPGDSSIVLQNPRRRDGKDVPYLQANISTIIVPMHRIMYIEVMPSEAEEKVITFVRE